MKTFRDDELQILFKLSGFGPGLMRLGRYNLGKWYFWKKLYQNSLQAWINSKKVLNYLFMCD